MSNCQLTLLKFEVNKMYFDLNENYRPDVDQKMPLEPRLSVAIMEAEDEKYIKKVTLSCFVFEEPENKNFPFTCSVQVSGTFRTEENEQGKKAAEHLIQYNATAILLPYLRAIHSQITCLAEKRPVRIPIINVYELFDSEDQDPA